MSSRPIRFFRFSERSAWVPLPAPPWWSTSHVDCSVSTTRTLADLVEDGPSLGELSPTRSGVAVIGAGPLGIDAALPLIERLGANWPAVVLRCEATHWPGPTVPVRPLWPGLLAPTEPYPAVWQSMAAGVRPPGPGPVLPRLSARRARHLLTGRLPDRGPWLESVERGLGDAVGVIERVASQIASGGAPLRRGEIAVDAGRRLRLAAPDRADELAGVVADHVLGLGPLEALLRDPEVTDVLVNGPREIWVERRGASSRSEAAFDSSEALMAAVERVIAPLGLRVDRSSPMVDARLPDGSRLHAVTTPAAVDHPIVAVRRFTQTVDSLRADDPVGTATADRSSSLEKAVVSRKTIIVSGGTGAGKTTLLNLLGGLIPGHERVVTIEDAAELRFSGHVVRLEAHPANAEGAGEVTIRSLVRSALRLQTGPDHRRRGPGPGGARPGLGIEHRSPRVHVHSSRQLSRGSTVAPGDPRLVRRRHLRDVGAAPASCSCRLCGANRASWHRKADPGDCTGRA